MFYHLFSPLAAAFGLRDSSGGSERQCGYNDCWVLFEAAQEHYGMVAEILSDPNPDLLHSPNIVCIIIRTFHVCMKDKSRECRSDLGFHGAQEGIEKQMKSYKCNETGTTFEPEVEVGGPHHPKPSYVGECSYPRLASGAPPAYNHCGLFGDPHLRTFKDEFQTCRVQGAWPLIDNEHLTVQVTNEFVDMNEDTATATTKVTRA